MTDPLDWTEGAESLAYDHCPACGRLGGIPRPFCPACGSQAVARRTASGRGTVYAITTVHRAPSPELRAFAPYCIALVDADEGFRFMAQAAETLAIGDPVVTGFRRFGAGLVPFCSPAPA